MLKSNRSRNWLFVKLGLLTVLVSSLFTIHKWAYSSPTVGFLKNTALQNGFLTIGISSVHRKQEDYLIETLQSLIDKSTPAERENVTVVVCLADVDASIRAQMAMNISQSFRPHLQSGFLLVTHIPPTYVYPPLKHLRQTYNDSSKRVAWRAKQAIDFAHLFHFCRNLSQFYMILEDDIICLQGFLGEIRRQVEEVKGSWLTLHFSGFLIIGTLFNSFYLLGLSEFVRLFYAIQPVDYLIQQYFEMLAPGEDKRRLFCRMPSLFQHAGYYSTMDNKVQLLTDRTFPSDVPELYISNPTAVVFTTIKTVDHYVPDLPYSSNLSFFWGIPRQGNTYDIVFQRPIKISNVVIITGLPTIHDYLKHGYLLTSTKFIRLKTPNQAACFQFEVIANFVEGKVNVTQLSSPIQCLRILIAKPQKNWLIIRRIAVFT